MNQNEIWIINLDPTIGAEINKTRPAIIVSANSFGRLPLKVIVPITDWKDRFITSPWMVMITPSQKNGLIKTSSADCFQIRSLSESRFIKKIGVVDESISEKIKSSLSKVLAIYQ